MSLVQADQEKLLWKMEARMIDVEQKLRIVKMLLQEKVNQLKEQVISVCQKDRNPNPMSEVSPTLRLAHMELN